MDFEQYLKTTAQSIDQEVERIFAEFLNEVKKTNIKLLPFALGLINSCKGGKRIRGVLVKLGYEIATLRLTSFAQGKLPRNDIVRIGAAFEILHAAILIHDDVIDQSPTRRGQPSLFKMLGGDHYGVSQAISLGDIGLFLPLKIISEANFLGEYKIKALSHLAKIIISTGWGQILDVELPIKKGRLEEDAKFINTNKTAKYTIAGPLQMGAILAGADDKLIRELGEFGEDLGIAFQIKDDILDGETQSVEASSEALDYAKKAKKMIPEITSDGRMRKLLEQMTEFMVERSK